MSEESNFTHKCILNNLAPLYFCDYFIRNNCILRRSVARGLNQKTPQPALLKLLTRNLADSPHMTFFNLHVALCREHLIMNGFR